MKASRTNFQLLTPKPERVITPSNILKCNLGFSHSIFSQGIIFTLLVYQNLFTNKRKGYQFQVTWPLSSQTAMAKAPGSLAPRTDCLGQTRTLAGWPSSPGQRNTLWATSFSISQLVSLVKEEKEIKIHATDSNDEAANINWSIIVLAKMSSCQGQGKCLWTGGRH